jgi:hypothetical protein
MDKPALEASAQKVLSDFSEVQSNSLNALIIESNRVGKVVFAKTVDEAITLLK